MRGCGDRFWRSRFCISLLIGLTLRKSYRYSFVDISSIIALRPRATSRLFREIQRVSRGGNVMLFSAAGNGSRCVEARVCGFIDNFLPGGIWYTPLEPARERRCNVPRKRSAPLRATSVLVMIISARGASHRSALSNPGSRLYRSTHFDPRAPAPATRLAENNTFI